MKTNMDRSEDQNYCHGQEERSWWRVWVAVALSITALSFGATKVYYAGFAAGVDAARAVDRGVDEHKASGCGQDSCPYFVPQDPEPRNNKITL